MRQRLLGRRTGLRVSQMALGCGSLGLVDGSSDAGEARRALVAFADAGGTFIDTSSAHQDGRSEEMIGAFIAEAGRDRFVVSTKYGRPPAGSSNSLRSGSHRGALLAQADASLRRLKTDRIDLYTVEFPDGVTPLEEIIRGMETLVAQGKVVAIALSNFAAWEVARGATLADNRGWAPVAALHYQYNLVERSAEREHLAMAEALGLAVLAWSPQARGSPARVPLTGLPDALATALSEVADETSATTGVVALAWLLNKGVIPVIGARTVRQLQESLPATDLALADDQVSRLDASMPTSAYPAPLMARMRDLVGIDQAMFDAAKGTAWPVVAT